MNKFKKLNSILTNDKAGIVEKTPEVFTDKKEVDSAKSSTISLSGNDFKDVVESKVNAAIQKNQKVKVKKPKKNTEYAPTVVSKEIYEDVSWRLKKEGVFTVEINNYLYSRLINDKEFLKATIEGVKKDKIKAE